MHITYLGTPNFSKKILTEILAEGISVNAVVTSEDKPKQRGQKKKPSPVKELANKKEIAVFHEIDKVINKTDLVLVVAHGEIIKKKHLQKPKYGFLNVHPSLLPRYRGPTPIQAAILNDDEKTGVTIMLMDEKIDHGPILNQKKLKLTGREYYNDLEDKLSMLGGKLLAETIPLWINQKINPKKQEHQKATVTNLLTKKDGKVDWTEEAILIERKIRAYNPWPGVFSFCNNKRIKFFKAQVQKQTENGPFGPPGKTYLGTNEKIAVQTGKDFLLVEELQIEGRSKVTSEEFLRGNIDFIGNVLN